MSAFSNNNPLLDILDPNRRNADPLSVAMRILADYRGAAEARRVASVSAEAATRDRRRELISDLRGSLIAQWIVGAAMIGVAVFTGLHGFNGFDVAALTFLGACWAALAWCGWTELRSLDR